MIKTALSIHFAVNMDSALATTREFWRRKAGFDEAVVLDPRPLAVIMRERAEQAREEV